MEKFFALIVMAVLVEAVITYLSEIRSFKSPLLWSIALGIAVSVIYKIDIPATLGITTDVPYVGSVLTGIIMARGSNYIYDLIGRFTNMDFKPLEAVTIEDDVKEYNL